MILEQNKHEEIAPVKVRILFFFHKETEMTQQNPETNELYTSKHPEGVILIITLDSYLPKV